MSQDYHHHHRHHHHHPGLFSFGFERSQGENLQQIRREKFPQPPVAAAAAIQEEEETGGIVGNNETSGMLSEMFDFNFHHSTPNSTLQGFHGTPNEGGHFSQFTWPGNDGGLSLSLSSSLHHVKPGEEFRIAGDGSGMMFFGQGVRPAPSPSSEYPCKNNLNLISGMDPDPDPTHHFHVGFGSSIGLRNSKYAKAAQELLEDFCSVVRGQIRQFTKNNNNNNKTGSLNPNSNPTTTSDGGDGGDATNNNSPSSSTPPLSAAERIEHQRRKVKLLSMLDEVDRRYNRYCEQMQMVVNSFDLVMGFGAAGPYTALAQKAMSRHFRCLKEAVAAQLKHSCEMLGEKDGGASLGLTKGETPRLKMLEQSLRQQRAFHHQIGMMEPEAWRPQRGLPEKSVNALRAWLFEHFLHPYPSDADKHMLARQTGLSRSQVSNWFINARVRLWKPMVEEMYQQEVDDSTEDNNNNNTIAHSPTPNSPTTATTAATSPPPSAAADTVAAIGTVKRSEINAAHESDPSLHSINANIMLPATLHGGVDTCHRRFGTNAAGNVSLTLGLRHAGGNLPDKNRFFG